jgi:PAS domain S-box-containing protein
MGLRCWKMLTISDKQRRVLVVAPTGRDAHLLCEMLRKDGVACESCADVSQLCDEVRAGAGAILLTEEALGPGALVDLSTALGEQPKWSDLPVILLSSNVQRIAMVGGQMFRENGTRGNPVVVEKPVRPQSLRSTVNAALMTRTRQYKLRDYLDERGRAEAALRESEERYRLLVEGVKDHAIFMLDPEGRITTWNRGAERIIGYRAEEILGEHFSRFYPLDDLERGQPELDLKIAAEKGHYESEGWRVRKDGTRFLANVLITAVLDQAGRLRGYSKLTRDITERKRAEEALRTAQAELAHAARVMVLGELTASIAHEINQPLAALVAHGYACQRWLGRDLPDLDEARKSVEHMIENAMRAGNVIKGLRALVQKAASERESLDVNEIVRQVIDLIAGELRDNQVTLQTELQSNLPAVLGYRVQLQQVVLNLMLNSNEAMKEVPSALRKLVIRSETSNPADVTVAVRDSGPGMKAQELERIFDSFFSTKEGGLGLGLSISRTIVEAHGGRLWATLNEGCGATFFVSLPASGAAR